MIFIIIYMIKKKTAVSGYKIVRLYTTTCTRYATPRAYCIQNLFDVKQRQTLLTLGNERFTRQIGKKIYVCIISQEKSGHSVFTRYEQFQTQKKTILYIVIQNYIIHILYVINEIFEFLKQAQLLQFRDGKYDSVECVDSLNSVNSSNRFSDSKNT